MIKDNEKIYDEQIAPLMTQIVEICKANEIPMLCTFEYDAGEFCTTNLPVEGQSETIPRAHVALMRSQSPLMLTTRNADGQITDMTAIL